MSRKYRIALVGDYNPAVTAHQAIPKALAIASEQTDIEVEGVWTSTERLTTRDQTKQHLAEFNGVWCVPASPYKHTEGALWAIEFARTHPLPFFGSCGGYQHAVLEYARNELGYADADNVEINQNATMPLHRLPALWSNNPIRLSLFQAQILPNCMGQTASPKLITALMASTLIICIFLNNLPFTLQDMMKQATLECLNWLTIRFLWALPINQNGLPYGMNLIH